MKNNDRKALFNPDDVVKQLRHQLVEDYTNATNSRIIDPISFEKFVEAQNRAYTKKYRPFKRNNIDTRQCAINKFITVNDHIGRADNSFTFPYGESLRDPKQGFNSRLLQRAKFYTGQILEELDTEQFFTFCKHSTGTTAGLKFLQTDLSSKMALPLSSTSRAAHIFQAYLLWDTDMRTAYQHQYPDYRYDRKDMSHYTFVEYSRMTTVPKNDETDRTIAIEPTVNMFLQQGVGRYISDRLTHFGVDIQCQQDRHKYEAFISSIVQSHATIDFSSASDCVGIQLLRFLLPPSWFWVVDAIRCEEVLVEGNILKLNSIATMGNATTFPLETLVFYCLALACHSMHTSSFGPAALCSGISQPISVFGDDCIVPTNTAKLFMDVSESLGFIVNHEKSYFGSEQFRESCGGDYFAGRNVRGLYFKAPRSLKRSVLKAWLYTLWNSVLLKQISCFGSFSYVYKSSALDYVASLICEHFEKHEVVPDHFPDDSGIKFHGDYIRLKYKFKNLHVTFKINQNNSLTFKYLSSVVLDGEKCIDAFHYWNHLKTVKHLDELPKGVTYGKLNKFICTLPNKVSEKARSFESLKKEGGYVISTAIDLGGRLQVILDAQPSILGKDTKFAYRYVFSLQSCNRVN